MKEICQNQQKGNVGWQRSIYLSAIPRLLSNREMLWLGSVFLAMLQFRAPSIPKNIDTKWLPVALLQMTSVGKNPHHNKQPHPMETQRYVVTEQRGRINCSDESKGKVPTPRWYFLKGGEIEKRDDAFVWQGTLHSPGRIVENKSKILLSFHPTQSECVFAQPSGDPGEAGADGPIHPRRRELQRNKAGLTVHSVIPLEEGRRCIVSPWVHLSGSDDAKQEVSGSVFVAADD